MKSDNAFLRYGNFIDESWCQNRSVKSWFGEKRLFRVLEFNLCKVLAYISNSRSPLHKRKCCFYIISFQQLRVSIGVSKIYQISKPTLGPCFLDILLCTPITQSQVFQQVAPFDILSHILIILRFLPIFVFVFLCLSLIFGNHAIYT